MPVPPGPHEVRVWYRTTGDADAVDASAASLLSADERARCGRFAFARDRRDFAAAHALLRTSLSNCAGVAPQDWIFDTHPHGKPFVVSAPGAPLLACNLSHTPGFVACAISGGCEVGIDVESVDRVADSRRIAERYFSEAECAWLDAGPAHDRATRFIELWTLKEAYIKAIGLGLGHPLHVFGFAFEGECRIRFSPPPDTQASAWTFGLFAPSPRHRMAVAVAARASVVARSAEGTITRAIRSSDVAGG